MAHGSGGKLMQQLIEKMFFAAFGKSDNPHDGFVFENNGKLAFTTDSYVVKPLFFKGGDIGSLAVNGTVNDLASCGAKPLYLSASFIIEEGFAMEDLWQIVQSMKATADESGVKVVTGDTKIVDKGSADGIFINTSGVGEIMCDYSISPASVKDGDVVIVSGDIGRHGIAIMAEREGLTFESDIKSDCASISKPIADLIAAGVELHCVRDATRGGVSAVLNEIAQSSNLCIEIDESAIPIGNEVKSACELLGFNPLEVANEGCFIAFVEKKDVEQSMGIMQEHEICKKSCVIGKVSTKNRGIVIIKTLIGGNHILSMPSGELLPRIC